jgi:hypothetical protein
MYPASSYRSKDSAKTQHCKNRKSNSHGFDEQRVVNRNDLQFANENRAFILIANYGLNHILAVIDIGYPGKYDG